MVYDQVPDQRESSHPYVPFITQPFSLRPILARQIDVDEQFGEEKSLGESLYH